MIVNTGKSQVSWVGLQPRDWGELQFKTQGICWQNSHKTSQVYKAFTQYSIFKGNSQITLFLGISHCSFCFLCSLREREVEGERHTASRVFALQSAPQPRPTWNEGQVCACVHRPALRSDPRPSRSGPALRHAIAVPRWDPHYAPSWHMVCLHSHVHRALAT